MIMLLVLITLIAGTFLIFWHLAFPGIEKQIKAGFPSEWEKVLLKRVAFYAILSEEMKVRFRERVHRFILCKPIVGYQTTIDDEMKLLVASSAVMLTLAFERWNFNYLDGVMLVDNVSESDFSHNEGNVLGQLQTENFRSKMILSKSALVQGFRNMEDNCNVGIHEFAHALDHADGEIDGIPRMIMPESMIEEWTTLMGSKIKDIYNGKSEINEYGATSEAEFFAVISEYFFEKPYLMKQKHPQMYELLSKAFQQDTSTSFSANLKRILGQVKEKIGRNSPCPCGSGKKFKKCCMHI
ncbi:MAG: zinc-dependent peptidase [Chitinispirillaceae bacterium]